MILSDIFFINSIWQVKELRFTEIDIWPNLYGHEKSVSDSLQGHFTFRFSCCLCYTKLLSNPWDISHCRGKSPEETHEVLNSIV